ALIGVMLLVLATGAATRGSRRWIDLGFFRFQPSEFGKVLIAIFLAAYLSEHSKQIGKLSLPLRAILLAALPVLLVFVQPDIGTPLVYIAVLAAALFASGVRWVHLAAISLVGLFAVLAVLWWLPASGVNVLKPYQAQRLTGVFHPSSDPPGATYSVNQSLTPAAARGARRRRGSAASLRTGTASGWARSGSSAASSARRSCSCSTCSSCGGVCGWWRARATSSARSAPPGSRSGSCSRCTSTSG